MRDNKNKSKNNKEFIYIIFIAAVIILSLFFPILRIYGSSMSPTMTDGDLVVSVRNKNIHTGDIVVFKHDGKTLLRRCIAESGDWVNIDSDGNVYVNNIKLDEPYVYRKNVGECDIVFPYQVPQESFFVMGDNRGTAIDSRMREIGTIEKQRIEGKVLFRLFPINPISTNRE